MPALAQVLVCFSGLFKWEDFTNDGMDLECGKEAVEIFESRKGMGEFCEQLITGQLSDKIKEGRQTHCVLDPTCTPCKFSDFWMRGITIVRVSASFIYVEIQCESGFEGRGNLKEERRTPACAPITCKYPPYLSVSSDLSQVAGPPISMTWSTPAPPVYSSWKIQFSK